MSVIQEILYMWRLTVRLLMGALYLAQLAGSRLCDAGATDSTSVSPLLSLDSMLLM